MNTVLWIVSSVVFSVVLAVIMIVIYVKYFFNNKKNHNQNDTISDTDIEAGYESYKQWKEKAVFFRSSFFGLLNSTPSAVTVFNQDGKRLLVNNAFKRIFAVDTDFARGLAHGLWDTPALSDKIKDKIRNGEDFDTMIEINFSNPIIKNWFASKNTGLKYMEFSFRKFLLPGKTIPYICLICVDITEIEENRRQKQSRIELVKKIHKYDIIKIWRFYLEDDIVKFYGEGGVLSSSRSMDYFSVFEPRDVVLLKNSFDKIRSGKVNEAQLVMRIVDISVQGGYSYWHTDFRGVYEKGKLVKIEGICHKITYRTLLKNIKIKEFINNDFSYVTKFDYDVKTGEFIMPSRKRRMLFDDYLKNVHPKDLEANKAVISDIKLGKQIYTTISYRFKIINQWHNMQLFITPKETSSDGDVKVYSGIITTNPKWDKLVGSVKESDRLLKSIINSAACMLTVKDPDDDFRYVMANRDFCETFDLEQDMVKKRNDFDIFGKCDFSQKIYEMDKKVLSEGRISFEIDFEYEEVKYSLFVRKTVYVNSQKHRFIISSSINLSELKSAETKLARAQSAQKMSEQLKTVFLNSIGHEFNTPIHQIKGFVGLLTSRFSQEGYGTEEFITNINNACNDISRTITNLVDIAKTETGDIRFSYSYFDFGKFLNRLYLNFLPEIISPNVELILESPYPYCNVNGDKEYFKKIITIFVSNAIKNTNRGFVKMGYKYQNRGLYIYVEDSGCGISEEDKSKVFAPFEKINPVERGLGIGLALSKKIVEAYEGKIGFESQAGKGSLFWTWLPSEVKISDDKPISYESVADNQDDATSRLPKILVVENDTNNFLYVKAAVEDICVADRVLDGQMAVSKLSKEYYEVILMDIKLPESQELETVRKLRQSGNTTPIIAILDDDYYNDIHTIIEAGCNEFLARPVDLKKLKEILSKYAIE